MKPWRLALVGALAVSAALILPLRREAGTARAAASKKVALVVGNSRYAVKPLASPAGDAKRWADRLEQAGWTVDRCPDCKLQDMRSKLSALRSAIAPGDEALFYYSGHGAEENGISLLFPVDADPPDCTTLFGQTVTLNDVLGVMAAARVKVVVLDACRSSPFPTCTMGNDTRVLGEPTRMPSGTLIAYATRRGDPSVDPGGGSAFTRAVLPLAFQPGKALYDAVTEVGEAIKKSTGGVQEPWVLSNLSPASYALVPAVSPAVLADTAWSKVAAMPDGPEKTSAALSFLSDHGTSGAASVRAAQAWLTNQTGTRTPAPPMGMVGDPPSGGPTGRTYVAMRGTAGEMSFIGLSEGIFDMGSREGSGESDEHPQHRVRISGFALGQSEVTQAQWAAVVKAAQKSGDADAAKLQVDPSSFNGTLRPVESVSWCDAARFANALSRLEHRRPAYSVGTDCEQGGAVGWDHAADGYRLPTEAEWEYAARAGTGKAYYFGDDPDQLCGYANVADQTGKKKYPTWTIADCDDGQAETAPVCSYTKSPWGLCDMIGNVWEWTWDVYDSGWYGRSSAADPAGPADRGGHRVLRGGSWYASPGSARSANRNVGPPSSAFGSMGLRLVLPVPAPER